MPRARAHAVNAKQKQRLRDVAATKTRSRELFENSRESLIEAADVAVMREPRNYEAAAKWSSRDCGIIVFPDKAINTPTTVTALLVKGETPTVARRCEKKKTKLPSVVCSES